MNWEIEPPLPEDGTYSYASTPGWGMSEWGDSAYGSPSGGGSYTLGVWTREVPAEEA